MEFNIVGRIVLFINIVSIVRNSGRGLLNSLLEGIRGGGRGTTSHGKDPYRRPDESLRTLNGKNEGCCGPHDEFISFRRNTTTIYHLYHSITIVYI
ncbi:hypothetical protein B0O80DRAFT_469442 [Mortierella sp. GBAus27b]|nr:hypothetical protein B0O80DRAFT_469442 [Mortierella sp. GBAus27b]